LRRDTAAIGGENIEIKSYGNKLVVEVYLFLFFSVAGLFLFFTHIHTIVMLLGGSKLNILRAALILIVVSPFGAHLSSTIIVSLLYRLKIIK